MVWRLQHLRKQFSCNFDGMSAFAAFRRSKFLAKAVGLWYNVDMNGYDFDKTILRGNTVQRFWWYCVLRFPYLWLLLPIAILACLLFGLHIITKDFFLRMMEVFEIFVPNKPKQAQKFWDKNQKHLKQWYLKAKRDDDIVISASPDYLIEEICTRLGVRCIATKTKKNGMALGKHCYGAQKVVRFQESFPNTALESYYSDSMSDVPMFEFAKQGYFVRGETVTLVYQNGDKVGSK